MHFKLHMYYIIYLYICIYIYKLQKTRHSLICTWDHNDNCYSKLGPYVNTFRQNTQAKGYDICGLTYHPFTTSGTHLHSGLKLRDKGSQYHRSCRRDQGSGLLHCGDWCTPLVTKFELHTHCSLFVLCTWELKVHHRSPHFAHISLCEQWHLLFSSHST